MLVMMTEGGEVKQNTNINFLLEEFGIMVNSGECLCVVIIKNFSKGAVLCLVFL